MNEYVYSVIIHEENYDKALKRFRELIPEPTTDNDDGYILSILTRDEYNRKIEGFNDYLRIKGHIRKLKELL